MLIFERAPNTETGLPSPPTAKNVLTPFSFTIQIIPTLKCSLGFLQKGITWRINRRYNYTDFIKLFIGFAYVIKWAKLEKVPERVRSIRKLAMSMPSSSTKHISKQNGGETRGVGGARMWDYSKLQGFNGQQINQQSQFESCKHKFWICKDKADVMASYRLAPGLKLNWSHFWGTK